MKSGDNLNLDLQDYDSRNIHRNESREILYNEGRNIL